MTTRAEEKFADIANRRFTDGVVDEVTTGEAVYAVTYNSHYGIGIPRKHGIEPRPGDQIRVYGSLGQDVHGIDLNGTEVYYYTASEREARRREQIARIQNDKRTQFEQDRAHLDAAFDTLPVIFQRRIEKFRRTNPDFRWEFEGYEMRCCEDAVRIWHYLAVADDPSLPPLLTSNVPSAPSASQAPRAAQWEPRFLWFKSLPYADQVARTGISDAHSGNSFGFALRLAWWYAVDPPQVELEHGALTPLVGCEDYGCPHPYSPNLWVAP